MTYIIIAILRNIFLLLSLMLIMEWLICFMRWIDGFLFFFFQAEDGIRDKLVTGVQTCALPISSFRTRSMRRGARFAPDRGSPFRRDGSACRRPENRPAR